VEIDETVDFGWLRIKSIELRWITDYTSAVQPTATDSVRPAKDNKKQKSTKIIVKVSCLL